MRKIYIHLILLSLFSIAGHAMDSELTESRIKVALREVGHALLISSGDSISEVLPVVREGNTYTVSFEAEFQFKPEELVVTMMAALRKAQVFEDYLVEVLHCTSGEVAYSYEFRRESTENISCSKRETAKACYTVKVLFLEGALPPYISSDTNTTASTESRIGTRAESEESLLIPILIALALCGIGLGFFLFTRKKKQPDEDRTDLLHLGDYRFDKRNMTLYYKEEKTDLTSKEADLLYLLYQSENQVLERDTLLNIIWGDQGDYVGRTLDVFMSKLRKKLAYDTKLKIVNIRGIGYKFIIDK